MRTPSPLDIRVFDFINRRATHQLLDFLLPKLTHLGLGGIQLPLVLALCWVQRDAPMGKNLWWATLVAFLLSTALVHLIKRRVKRMRPIAHTEVRFLAPVTRHGSFPSGHTATTFALVTLLAWHFPLAAVPLYLLAAVIGYSRVYVGVHFLSDVLAAAVIGIVSGGLTLLMSV